MAIIEKNQDLQVGEVLQQLACKEDVELTL